MPTILIADEDPTVRTLIDQALAERGIEILFAPTGAEAVAQIERAAPDLVVCDVYMPDTDGYRVCEFVRSQPHRAATPVLLLADVVDATVLARAARVRSDDVLRKPFAADLLLARIRGLLPAAPADIAPACPEGSSGADGAVEPRQVLDQLAALPGVALSVLVDGEGFLIECAGEMAAEAEVVGAVIARLAGSADAIGGELGHGRLRGMSLEYGGRLVYLSDAGDHATLGLVLRDPARLEAVRRAVARALPACTSHEGPAMTGAR